MKHEILPMSVAILLALLWAFISSWLLIRMSVAIAPWNPLKFLRIRLSDGQNMLLGVLSFGGSLCIFDLAHGHILRRLYDGGYQPTLGRFLRDLVGDLFVGIFFGFSLMFTNRKRSTN